MVAAATIGSAVIGTAASSSASKSASSAAKKGARAAAQATIESTMMQIAEIARQFNWQAQILFPQIANQYAGQSAVMDLLGIRGGGGQAPTGVTFDSAGNIMGERDYEAELSQIDEQIAQIREGAGGGLDDSGVGGALGRAVGTQREIADLEAQRNRILQEQQYGVGGGDLPPVPGYPGAGSTAFDRGDRGQFIDPNLDQTRLADINTLPDAVRGNLLAGDPLAEDEYVGDIRGRRLAEGAAGEGVYGNVFQESPGYGFAREEMERQLERVGSAGGPNIGGRAIMEAQRRAKGLADQDYYRWAAGRERDLVRRGQAEGVDIGRDDQAVYNYLTRRAGDASRLDTAARQEDALIASDQSRGDQAYYNFLAQLMGVSGFGNPAGQAVNASQAAGQQTQGALASQGGTLANIYNQQGINQANINASTIGNYNNIFQQMMQNLMTQGAFGE